MYESYFGLERPPFQITPDPSLFFEGGKRGAVLDALGYAIERGEGIVKVVGEVGSGKTMICRMLELRVSDNTEIIYIANPSLGPDDTLMVIADELDLCLASEAGKHEVMRALQTYLVDLHAGGKQVVVFVEEAQGMPLETLEEIRLLSNLETGRHKLLQIVLFGQPELDENLASRSIRQLRERISHSFELPPLSSEDICTYLNFRMRQVGYKGPDLITRKVARAIARYSDGLIRRVNILADKTLLAAYSANTHGVKARHVKQAAKDSAFPKFRHARSREAPRWLFIGSAAMLGLTLAAIGGLVYLGMADPAARLALASAEEQAGVPADTPGVRSAASQDDRAVPNAPPSQSGSAEDASASSGVETEGAPSVSTATASGTAAKRLGPRGEDSGLRDQVTSTVAENDLRERPAVLSPRDLVLLGNDGRPESLTAAGVEWLEERIRRSREWMSTAGPDRVTIQIMTREKAAAHNLVWHLNKHWPLDLDRTYVDEVGGRGSRAYRVFFDDFEDWQAARAEFVRLPPSILRSQPYLRRVPAVSAVATSHGEGSRMDREVLAGRSE